MDRNLEREIDRLYKVRQLDRLQIDRKRNCRLHVERYVDWRQIERKIEKIDR